MFRRLVLASLIVTATNTFAATPIDLRHQSIPALKSLRYASVANDQESSYQTIKSVTDFTNVKHVRIKQKYHGYPVWGGDAAMHGNKMNGTIYQGLTMDLANTPPHVFQPAQADKALQFIKAKHHDILSSQIYLMVYIDKTNKAHWAFYIELRLNKSEPIYIIDANTFTIFETWNNFKTLDDVQAGGYGGNYRNTWIYDFIGVPGANKHFDAHWPALTIKRDANTHICYMQNDDVTIKDNRDEKPVMQFLCNEVSSAHNNLYWNEQMDEVNGANSPANDVLYNATQIKEMYLDLTNTPILVDDNGQPMQLSFNVHVIMENASWSDYTKQMYIGDGGDTFFPLTTIDVIAHELSHGFTSQNSGLIYAGQSGGLNEAFSDMAGETAVAYTNMGYVSWHIGDQIMKDEEQHGFRFMDNPRADCVGKSKNELCSIDNAKNYNDQLDVHNSSGVFNKAFYLLSTSPNWDIFKAFKVMVQANQRYWLPRATFKEAACGVLDATRDYGYDTETVVKIMAQVGVDTSGC